MVLDVLASLLGDKEPKPNKFTIAIGQLIRRAREDTGLSQTDLAELIYRRRATITDLESGKHEPDISTIVLIAAAVNKPLSYFVPNSIRKELSSSDLSVEEQELLYLFREVWDENLQRVAIQLVKVLAEFDPEKTILEAMNTAKDKVDVERDIRETLLKRRKGKSSPK